MYRGQLVEEKTSEDFFKNARHPYSRDLLKARPRAFDGRFHSIPGSIPNAYEPLRGCGYCDRCDCRLEQCGTETPPLQEDAAGNKLRCHMCER